MTAWEEALAVAREQIAYHRDHGHSPGVQSLRALLRAIGCHPTKRRDEWRVYEAWLAAAWMGLRSDARQAA